MSAPVVEVKNLSVCFGRFYAVKNISFSVAKGEIFGFLGANGAGKTTTIRVLCGLLPASEGYVSVGGIEFLPGRENLIKQKVGYMSQRFTLYDELSVKENMDFAAGIRRLKKADYEKHRQELLDFIGFKQKLSTVVRDLPGGIKQEVALCQSLLHDPEIIFLDEPTAGVAPAARFRFWQLIGKLAAAGKTIFVTTHYMDEAENCGRIALMRSGELIELDSPQNLKAKTFSRRMYSLTPKGRDEILPDLRAFTVWEPYGQHYHAVFKDDAAEKEALPRLKKNFHIEEINPSLEDVFIRIVEGDGR